MRQIRVLWHLMRADFLERVRRYSFLMTLAFAVYLGYAVSAGHLKLWIDDARGIYNSAWVGVLMALVINTFLSLAGFYVVKGSVERDRRTGVGQILAATPLSKPLYALGKTASNLAVLLAMVAVLCGMAFVAQLMAGEETRLEVWKLVAPILVFSVPMMTLVAALAVLFEMIPGLRSGLGNVVWFFVWNGLMLVGIFTKGAVDPFGLGIISRSLFKVVKAQIGGTGTDFDFRLGAMISEESTRIFHFDGMEWTSSILVSRLFWTLAAASLALLAAVFFDRFDPSRVRVRARKSKRAAPDAAMDALVPVREGAPVIAAVHLQPLPPTSRRYRFLPLLQAEMRLLLKRLHRGWYLVALGLVIAGIAAPLSAARQVVLPLAWIWPVLLWSGLGIRESRHATTELIFSAARPLHRQLPAVWLSGVLLAAIMGGIIALRLVLAGEWVGVGAWVVGALFIPTFALALGVWSGGSKLFEALYLLLWYIGPMNRMPALDYLGATGQGQPLVWLTATIVLGAAAVVGRKRQLQK
ncbi:MAG TPA: hypothetical protein VE078_16620 [Thermoanaerobaculia bacterium]|nr:hypothetical protein [Thermoanaerobaculia bacterium]